jgi:hypothetical protein
MSDDADLVVRGFLLSPAFAGFVRGEAIDNEAVTPGLGVTVKYHGGPRGEATVFVYDNGRSAIPDGPFSAAVREEYENSIRDVFAWAQSTGNLRAELLGQYVVEASNGAAAFLCAEFMFIRAGQPRRSFVYLTAINGFLLKVRVTVGTADSLDASAYEFVQAVASRNWRGKPAERERQYVVRVGAESYEVLGLVRVGVFGPWRWQARRFDGPAHDGVVFGCYPQDNPNEVAYLMVVDVSNILDEPDISSMTPEDAMQFDRRLEQSVREQMAEEHRRLVKWMSSTLNETTRLKQLVTTYVAEDAGRERQYIDVRLSAGGRRLVVGGCFDVDQATKLAMPIWLAIGNAMILDGMARLGRQRATSMN